MGRSHPVDMSRRRRHYQSLILAAGLLAWPASVAMTADCGPKPASIEGFTRAVDGDTLIDIDGGRQLRLWGIDAPELRGGDIGAALRAREHLDRLVRDSHLYCAVLEQDAWCRLVVVCFRNTAPEDIAVAMLTDGHAWVMRRYAWQNLRTALLAAAYEAAEEAAKRDRRGIWSRLKD